MSKSKHEQELAARARLWEEDKEPKKGWQNAPEAVPAAAGTLPMTLRIPAQALQIIRELARRKNMDYQVLLMQWIDDRLRLESDSEMTRLKKTGMPPHEAGK